LRPEGARRVIGPSRTMDPRSAAKPARSASVVGAGPKLTRVSSRSDDRQDLGPGEHLGGDLLDVVERDRLDAGHHLVDAEEPVVDELGLAQP
jgi:hypothetical protein